MRPYTSGEVAAMVTICMVVLVICAWAVVFTADDSGPVRCEYVTEVTR
jgi:hypothetical protein